MRVAIVGAGLAGLACGCELTERGHDVTVFEKRPWAGGKAYSFTDPDTGETVDNGQHIFMRCTTAYVDFLRRIGTLHLTMLQRRLSVPVIGAEGRVAHLAASPLPAPLHLLPSFARYAHLALYERARIARAVTAISRMRRENRAEYAHDSFARWLRSRGQSESAIREFWDLIVVPALNCRSEQASAETALFVFQEGFLRSAESAALGLPRVGLSELHADPALRYIEARGGKTYLRTTIDEVEIASGGFSAIRRADGARERFDACVIALPPRAARAILPADWRDAAPFQLLGQFDTSPIVNVHLWFDGPVSDLPFAAFAACELQWCFNRTRIALLKRGARLEYGQNGQSADREAHLVLSLSAADEYLALEKPEILDHLLPQLHRALPASRTRRLRRAVVVKEPDATFVPAPGLRRPGNHTPVRHLFLAGAYTDTGWPATMESAVRSGLAAAEAVDARIAAPLDRAALVVA
jgi:squalene-associated FAD-dependent desaturase